MPRMKFLSLAALFALCIVFSGAALAADSWDVTADDFPASLVWDAGRAVSVDATNDGTTSWTTGYKIFAVDGPTATATAVDRWGVIAVPVGATVAPTASYAFDFGITAPPISTLSYAFPTTPTTPPALSSLDCNWLLADAGDVPILTDASENDISVLRFSDTVGVYAPYVEQCAGRVPGIVGGYGDNTYRPNLAITRDQMAVFMQRAMQLPLSNYTGGFSDIAVGYWADDYIQSCVDGGIVGGFGNGTYRPTIVVNRDSMAVFVSRGMAGGDAFVPSGPVTPTFTDVLTGHWAYKYVEYCVASSVVGGYLNGTYRPTLPVDRGQMSIFVYRAAIQPTGAVVVLAGPAVTANPAVLHGWTSAAAGDDDDPGVAYLAVDAVRADALTADITVTFELRNAATPTTAATGAYKYDTTISTAEVDAAKVVADTTGEPYCYELWDIPAGLTPDNYILVVTVDGVELLRKPAFTIN